jgi:hypothetical protein
MHTILETASNKTKSAIGIPQTEMDTLLSLPYRETTLLRNLSFKNLQFAKNTLISLHKVLEEDLFHPRKDARKRIKIAYRLIMANLVACVFQRKELSVSGTAKSYLKKEYLGKRFLTKRAVNKVLTALEANNLIVKTKGNPLSKEVNKYLPTKQLEKLCLPLIYSVVESYDERKLIVVNPKKESETERYYANTFNIEDEQTLILPETHPDIVKLKRINEALQKATFAFKSPITRIYSNNDVIQGGRLYCAFQRLPDRRARIRINTLLNGLPCVEVDLSCNHPAMLMALNGLQLPRDWYSYIASKANCSRNKVKFLVTRMIGAEDRSIDLRPSAAMKNGIPIADIPSIFDREQIEYVIADEFPELNKSLCSGGIGVFLQNLEGEILLNAMDELVNQGILSLPVHDSLCVQYIFEKEAIDAIEKSWMNVLGVGFKPWIKVDYSDNLPSKP